MDRQGAVLPTDCKDLPAHSAESVCGISPFWFAASLDAFYHAQTVASGIFWGGVSAVMMFMAAFRADEPTSSFMPFRLLSVALWILDLVQGFRAGDWAGLEFWILVLFAEYAAALRVLPPASSVSIRHRAGPSRER